jgi:hypothetical protein
MKPIWSRDVKILENKFVTSKEQENPENEFSLFETTISNEVRTTVNQNNESRNSNNESRNSNNNSRNLHYNAGIDELALLINVSALNNEPKTFKQAMESPENIKWKESMITEITELVNQETWDLIKIPHNSKTLNILKGKWVYKIKYNALGKIIKYKSR